MEFAWIVISIFAALMQAVRTAAQKTLNQSMSTLATTYMRSLFGIPLMVVYLVAVLALYGGGVPDFTFMYVFYAAAGSITQVLATMLLIYMFKLKNFAVGTMLTKVDLVMTAVIGALFFSEQISLWGFVALIVVMIGVLLMTLARTGTEALKGDGGSFLSQLVALPTQVALACAFGFTLSYLFLREATLIMGPGTAMWRAAWTVVVAIGMQVVFVGIWMWLKEPHSFRQIWPHRRIATFIGVTSALGSIGWFTAFAMQNASYVRAVGQIEVVFTLLISVLYFKERIRPLEYWGMALTIVGVIMFRLGH